MAYERERYWISYYDSFKNGYNMNEGGTGGLGYKHTDEDIQKMSELKKEKMKDPKEKEKLSEAHNDYKKPIVQISLLDNSITHWESKNQAGRELNVQVAGIYAALKRDSHFAHDSLWFYEKDYINIDFSRYKIDIDVYRRYTKYYQYTFKGELLKIWTYDELNNSKYKNRAVFDCCEFKRGYYSNTAWLYEKDICKIDDVIEKYKNKINIFCEPIDVFDLNNTYIRTSQNIYLEASLHNFRSYDIYLCCEGKRKSAYNYIFKYKNKPNLYDDAIKNSILKAENKLNHIRRKIVQYDLNMNVIKIWSSITDIYKTLGYDKGTIIDNCKGRSKTSHNFIWRYYEECDFQHSSF